MKFWEIKSLLLPSLLIPPSDFGLELPAPTLLESGLEVVVVASVVAELVLAPAWDVGVLGIVKSLGLDLWVMWIYECLKLTITIAI